MVGHIEFSDDSTTTGPSYRQLFLSGLSSLHKFMLQNKTLVMESGEVDTNELAELLHVVRDLIKLMLDGRKRGVKINESMAEKYVDSHKGSRISLAMLELEDIEKQIASHAAFKNNRLAANGWRWDSRVDQYSFSDEQNISGSFIPTLTNNTEEYMFIEATQSNGQRAWTSPIWVTYIST
jgi:hypothetical protein